MIRLLIPVIALFLIWLLFFSSFEKKHRIGLSILVTLATVVLLWFDLSGNRVRETQGTSSEIAICGVEGEYSYRTNFNLDVCISNNSAGATVKRLELKFMAENCQQGACQLIQEITEEIKIEILPGEQVQHVENLSFDLITNQAHELQWSAEIVRAWTLKRSR